ncbi:CinA family protein [Pseudothauera rhizosphaerae]|uniref:Nicotinamide-nucleotide amidohydrolase family protein n=1 Tax=Pseudothauera rhizosphaerae TaxID=2565932 RepID=A0A4S4AR24_9RHOO|nr:nicotinamide-nucleotide amidohydrolase family protein [Pseudothauera rhizosphaerae]THF62204.1 nicotinamide-nucleotide amidohydrolase family protein [Pseudothauera rhizosphaerae]
MDAELAALSREVGEALRSRGWKLASAESCTGGWIAEAVTATAGSSEWFDRGFVTYSNEAKCEMLEVSPILLAAHGAVSEPIVREMAVGALAHSRADVAVAVSGIAGPSGGTPDKPVGTVCLAWGVCGEPPRVETRHFAGDREAVRRQTVICALAGVIALACGRGDPPQLL